MIEARPNLRPPVRAVTQDDVQALLKAAREVCKGRWRHDGGNCLPALGAMADIINACTPAAVVNALRVAKVATRDRADIQTLIGIVTVVGSGGLPSAWHQTHHAVGVA